LPSTPGATDSLPSCRRPAATAGQGGRPRCADHPASAARQVTIAQSLSRALCAGRPAWGLFAAGRRAVPSWHTCLPGPHQPPGV